MKHLKEDDGADSATQVSNVASGVNGKIDTFKVVRKPDENGFYEMLLELDDYKE